MLLVDDHPVVRQGLASLLGTLDGIRVVAQASSGETAVREALLSRPAVVVMDLSMPGMDGAEATRRIVHDRPGIAVLVLTMFDDDAMVVEALRAGARGYLLKSAEQTEIDRAIRAVAAGEAIFSAEVAGRVLDAVSTRQDAPRLAPLTPREREVLDMMATGATNSAIAHALKLAPKTVGNHVSAIFGKLGVATRAQAVVIAKDAGLGRHV